jgi:hypothetical protein
LAKEWSLNETFVHGATEKMKTVETTFVFGEIEVKKTGRVAVREVGKKRQELVEITPIDEDQNGNWRKWISPNVLFEVHRSART